MAETTPAIRPDLARSPLAELAGLLAVGAVTGERGVTLREVPFLSMISIRVRPGSTAAARLELALGAPLPSYGRVSAGAGHNVLWQGPDEFLVVSGDDAARLTGILTRWLGTEPGLVVDLSANRTTLELAGPSARAVLEKGCTLDLHPRAFTPGMATVTQLASAPVILWQTEDTPAYRLLPRSSFAEYTAKWLLDAMAEFADPEVP